MAYTEQTWTDHSGPTNTAPESAKLTAARMTHIESGVGDAHSLAETALAAAQAAEGSVTVPDATTSVAGKVRLASSVSTATDTAITPAAVKTVTDARMTVVNHGSNASTARPTGAVAVYWIGTVAPTNMTSADLYNGPA